MTFHTRRNNGAFNRHTERTLKNEKRAIGRIIAVFGRFTTSFVCHTVESALYISDAYGLHEMYETLDFWTATEEYKLDKDGNEIQTGAAGMGYTSLHSSYMYHYSGMSVRTLIDGLSIGYDMNDLNVVKRIIQEVREEIMLYLETAMLSAPVGMQHRKASFPDPVVSYITVGRNIQNKTMSINRLIDFDRDPVEQICELFDDNINNAYTSLREYEEKIWVPGTKHATAPEGTTVMSAKQAIEVVGAYFDA